MRRYAVISIVGLLVLASVFGVALAQASDASGCEGLSRYSTEMYKAGNAYGDALHEDSLRGRSPVTFSSDDWAAFADDALAYQKDLRRITPPDWAKEWHQTQIVYAGLAQQMGLMASSSGFLSILALSDQIDATKIDANKSAAIVVKGCADFAAFVRDWNRFLGIDDAATPTP